MSTQENTNDSGAVDDDKDNDDSDHGIVVNDRSFLGGGGSDHGSSHNSSKRKKKKEPSPFALALEAKDIDKTREILNNGMADPNQSLYNGQTPLYLASFIGFTDGIELLLAHGADPNLPNEGDGNTPLYASAVNDQYGTGDIQQHPTLDTYEGFTAGIRLLLDHGADPNKETRSGESPLYGAAVHGDAFCIKILLERGADANRAISCDARTPLYGAAASGQRHVLKYFLRNGADPDKATKEKGETPLFAAAANGHYVCVKYLIYQGAADWNKTNYEGLTPLCAAVHKTDGEYFKELVLSLHHKRQKSDGDEEEEEEEDNKNRYDDSDEDSSVDGDNANGDPAMSGSGGRNSHKAVLGVRNHNHEECVKLLVERGAAHPMKKAIELGNEELVDIILRENAEAEAAAATAASDLGYQNQTYELEKQHRKYYKFLQDRTFVLFKPSNRAFMLFLLSRDDLPWIAKQIILERVMEEVEDDKLQLVYLHATLEYLSAKSIEHTTIFLLMFDFYMYIMWIVAFAIVSLDGVNEEPKSPNAMGFLIAPTLYFMVREFFEFLRSGYGYIRDYWNWVNWATIVLVLITALGTIQGKNLVGTSDVDLQFKRNVTAAGAFICLSFVGYLKVTFLAFSNFVGGVAQIIFDLIPFATITLIVLFAFSFMYFIQDPGSEGFEDLGTAFFTIFTQFVSGLDGTTGPLDLVFGIVSVIILLNVVIAIVSSSWENAVDESLILLCQYRLELLRQVASIYHTGEHKPTRLPEDYDEHYDRFIETWVLSFLRPDYKGEEWWHLELSEEERKQFEMKMKLWAILSPPLKAVLIVIPWILGIVSFGLLWPKHIREFLFGIVPEEEELPDMIAEMKDSGKQDMEADGEASTLNAKEWNSIRKQSESMADDISELRRDLRTSIGSSRRQSLTLEQRIGRMEERMDDVSNDIRSIKETNNEILRLLSALSEK